MNIYVFVAFILLLAFLVIMAGTSTTNKIPVGTILIPLVLLAVVFLYNRGKYVVARPTKEMTTVPEGDLTNVKPNN